MSNSILRLKATYARFGLGRTDFDEKIRHHRDDDPYVPGTDDTVRRLRAVPLGERSIGFFSDEIDTVIEALRRWRDRQPALPPARPPRRAPARHAAARAAGSTAQRSR
jgi:predicted DNA-binding transcriptional regulator AlpA